MYDELLESNYKRYEDRLQWLTFMMSSSGGHSKHIPSSRLLLPHSWQLAADKSTERVCSSASLYSRPTCSLNVAHSLTKQYSLLMMIEALSNVACCDCVLTSLTCEQVGSMSLCGYIAWVDVAVADGAKQCHCCANPLPGLVLYCCCKPCTDAYIWQPFADR
jgi:hypothetical protein